MNSARWFMRRIDDAPRRTPADSPFRQFVVRCLKCDSSLLRVSCQFDEESGEAGLLRVSPHSQAGAAWG